MSRGMLRSPPTYGPARDAPGISPRYQPANMSISSIVGSDAPATSRAHAWSPQSTPNGRPPSNHSHHPPSPRNTLSYGPIMNDARPPGPPAPQYGPVSNTYAPNDVSTGPHTGPGTPKQSPSSVFKTRQDSRIPPRPYSQPGPEAKIGSRREMDIADEQALRARRDLPFEDRRVNQDDRALGHNLSSSSRDRAFSDLGRPSYTPYRPPDLRPMYGPAPRPPSPAQPNGREDGRLQYGRWSPRHAIEIRDADRPIASREGPQLPPEQLEGPMYGPFLPHDPRSYHSNMPMYGPHPRPVQSFGDQSAQTETTTSSFHDKQAKPLLDAHLRRSLEDSQMSHRSILGASQEAHRRLERFSPLPQAVQGASGQPVGSGRDPTIKSEFGRMFSGLGSGVGSTPVPMAPASNGSPTPNRGDRRTSHPDGLWDRPSRSPGAERLKRAYEAEGRFDVDGIDGRTTPGLTGSRGKRTKHSHMTPHHHHHPLGHQYVPGTNHKEDYSTLTRSSHHHRHTKMDEDTPSALLGRRISSTPFNTLKFSNGLSNGPPTPGSIRGHHHHPPHHHHHHRNAAQLTPAPVHHPRPVTTIKTSPLVGSVAHLPRKHLGSQLYAPWVTPPPASTASFSKFQFASKPKALPLFEDRENCTFTVRVPREFLTDRAREHVVSERQVWGTDVYTDDSDVLAAAIHSGWIRGAWGEDVDVSMLELNTSLSLNGAVNGESNTSDEGSEKREPCATLSGPPEGGPVAPPTERDAHITILILPPLEKYSPCTWHGMRSRSWGDNHDGMSFKIHRIEWADEGPQSRWSEKGAKEQTKRLATNRQAMSRCGIPSKVKHKHKAGNRVAAAS